MSYIKSACTTLCPSLKPVLLILLLFATTSIATNADNDSGAANPSQASDSPLEKPITVPGQSATLLPDGRWLLVGGIESGQVSNVIAFADLSSSQTPLPTLHFARAGHTATVLPDGSIFVFGGTDGDGNVIANAEIIDLPGDTVGSIATIGLTARTRHTATLLTDGRVLLAGGIGSDNKPTAAAQLWNPRTSSVDVASPPLLTPRYDHSATLLGSGDGRIAAGRADAGSVSLPTELFNPTTGIFEPTSPDDPRVDDSLVAARGGAPMLADTLPTAEAVDVAVNMRIAFRFTEPLSMPSLNSSTITLVGPGGAVSSRVVGAESGMLAFLTPNADLAPGTTYTAFIEGATDLSGRRVALASVRFTTHRYETPAEARTDTTVSMLTHPIDAGSSTKLTTAQSVAVAKSSSAAKTSPVAKGDVPQKTAEPEDIEDWSPQDENRHGQWRVLGLAHDPALDAAGVSTRDLIAPADQTGVAGHVLRINGKPLSGVAVSIGSASTTTDASGRFLLTNIAVGEQKMLVDGTAVTRNGWHYTKHYVQVQVSGAHTTTLARAVYLPRVDPTTEVVISSPASQEIVLTHPAIPGLEVRIPKGTVLRENDGRIVTSVSITPIPVDRAPFPTPKNFSAYFTLQPGGAFVDGDATKSIKVIYPNYLGLAPGAQVNFYNYDPVYGGWSIYGHGIVTKDGRQVAPADGVGFRQIMSFGFAIGSTVPPNGPIGGGCKAADPVDCATGFFTHAETDLKIKDSLPISVTRMYQSNDPNPHAFGVGTNISYAMSLYTPDSDTDVYLVLADGSQIHYALQPGSPQTWANLDSPTLFYGSIMRYVPGVDGQIDTTNDLITITLTDRTVLSFVSDSNPNPLLSITDPNGNTVQVTLQNGRSGPITQITSPNGRYIQFTYDNTTCNRITQAQDNLGRKVIYSYYSSATACMGGLYQVTDQDNHVETFKYDSSNRLQSMSDKKNNQVFYNTYNSNNQVTNQILADGAIWQFGYGTNVATITDPRGYTRQETFNASGYLTQYIY